jgi:hypothetical protein
MTSPARPRPARARPARARPAATAGAVAPPSLHLGPNTHDPAASARATPGVPRR